MHIQGVLLPDRQTWRGDRRHEDKQCSIREDGEQTSSVGAMDH